MLSNGRLTVGTVAVPIDGVYNQYARMILHNDDNTDAVYIGAAGVTTLNGLVLQKEQNQEFMGFIWNGSRILLYRILDA